MIGRLVALSAAVGCAPCPALSEVPIAGGDASLAAIVRQELEAIEGELALGVCVDHVRLDAGLRADRYGTYDPVTHGVRLAARDSAADVTRTLRHEVCHAVDLQNDVVLGSEALFPYPNPPPVADAHLVNEAFAEVCELGAEALTAAWSDGCGGDPDTRALDYVRDVVFGGGDPGQGAVFQPVATYAGEPLASPVHTIALNQGELPGRLLLNVWYGAGAFIRSDEVDIWTGQPTDRTYRSLGNPDPVAGSAPPRWWAGKGGPLRADAPDGDVVSIAELSLPTGRVTRAVARVDGVWGPAAGPCANDTTTFFTFDGELWSGQYSDGALSWGRWVPGP